MNTKRLEGQFLQSTQPKKKRTQKVPIAASLPTINRIGFNSNGLQPKNISHRS